VSVRDLDWKLIAYKIVLLDTEGKTCGFSDDRDTYGDPSEVPPWTDWYTAWQKRLGVHPMNAAEGRMVKHYIIEIRKGGT
jgi:hypothetical protein